MSDEWGRGRSSKRKGAPRTNDISHKGESDTSHQGQTPQDALERGLLQDLIQSDQAGASPVLLPLEVISEALLFVDSATLTETRYVCQVLFEKQWYGGDGGDFRSIIVQLTLLVSCSHYYCRALYILLNP